MNRASFVTKRRTCWIEKTFQLVVKLKKTYKLPNQWKYINIANKSKLAYKIKEVFRLKKLAKTVLKSEHLLTFHKNWSCTSAFAWVKVNLKKTTKLVKIKNWYWWTRKKRFELKYAKFSLKSEHRLIFHKNVSLKNSNYRTSGSSELILWHKENEDQSQKLTSFIRIRTPADFSQKF